MPIWVKIAVIVLFLIIVSLIILYGYRVVYGIEYGKRLNELEKNRETWLRHQEAVMRYQQELFEYLWNLGEYRYYEDGYEKDKFFMSCMENVWLKNSEKFQSNMSQKESSDES